jgi:Caspase domain
MKKALLVGIHYTPPPVPMNGCIQNTVQMANMLSENLGYEPQNITILRDDIGPMPTRVNILNALSQLGNESGGDLEEIWFYYSGHMMLSGNLEDCIVPVDYKRAGLITNADFMQIVQRISCRCIFVFDAYKHLSFCNMEWSYLYRSPRYCVQNQLSEKGVANPNIIVYSASRENAGVFTDTFLNRLKEKEYNYSAIYLYGDICTFFRERGYQTPSFSASSAEIATGYSFQKVDSKKVDGIEIPPETEVLPPPQPETPILGLNLFSGGASPRFRAKMHTTVKEPASHTIDENLGIGFEIFGKPMKRGSRMV